MMKERTFDLEARLKSSVMMDLSENSARTSRPQAGQAMAEMVVAMVAIIAVLSGLLFIARLATARTKAMHEARGHAGERAMQQLSVFANPAFIRDWDPGPDETTYSRDDERLDAAPSDFTLVIPEVARPRELGAYRPGNPVSTIASSSSPQEEFHMVRGHVVRDVPVPRAIQRLIYDADTIDVHGEVWMIYTRGID